MNRQERLKFCKVCLHQKNDIDKGILCSITNQQPTFEVECTMFKADKLKKHDVDMADIRNAIHQEEADKGTRLVNYIIDRLAMIAIAFVLFFAYEIVQIANGVSTIKEPEISTLEDFIISAIIAFIYYTIMEVTTGRTIGKLITKTKVINADGNKPDLGTIVIRSLSRIVPFNALSFLFSDKGWHDRWSDTRVVKVK